MFQIQLEHFSIIRTQPTPPSNHLQGYTISGGWAGEWAGDDFIWSANALHQKNGFAGDLE